MQNVIVGTSGHVDHGKTCLIKALTGTDTDRLKEEKKRGITIELGFANLPNEEGLHIGIIDVPGHEKFVKNMLAGIGGIDLVLFVVALDEGVMPQTIEHFEILKMLHIPRGILVLTKADLVDEDWADLVEADVRDLVKGSFLEGADCLRVSAYNGQNMDKLRELILSQAKTVGRRRTAPELFRLPVDRVFAMEGFGTVVTGTLLEGNVGVGDEIMVYPGGKKVKVRGIQSHQKKEMSALAGQRTALNLAGVSKEEMERGQVLARPGALRESLFLDCAATLFSSAGRQMKNGSRVHISLGAAQMTAKVILLGKIPGSAETAGETDKISPDEIGPGESAYVQFRFDEPVAAQRGDRFIIRFYSPVETFGGGVVLNPCPLKHKRNQAAVVRELSMREKGTEEEVLELCLKEESLRFVGSRTLALDLNETADRTEELLEKLKKKKTALSLNDGSWFHKEVWEQTAEAAKGLLAAFHEENPIAQGMEKEEFKNRLLGKFYIKDGRKGEVLLNELVKRGVLSVRENAVSAAGFTAGYTAAHSDMRRSLLEIYGAAGAEAPDTDTVLSKFPDKKQAKQVLGDLVKEGKLVKLNPGAFLLDKEYEKVTAALYGYFDGHETMALGDFRDLLGTSRKYVLLILEHFDQKKITKLQGDLRILLKKRGE